MGGSTTTRVVDTERLNRESGVTSYEAIEKTVQSFILATKMALSG